MRIRPNRCILWPTYSAALQLLSCPAPVGHHSCVMSGSDRESRPLSSVASLRSGFSFQAQKNAPGTKTHPLRCALLLILDATGWRHAVAAGKKAKLSKTRTRQDQVAHYNPVAADYSSAAGASNGGLFDAELAADAKDGRGGDAVELAEFVDGGVVLFGDFGESVAFLDGVIDFFGLLGLNWLGGLNGIA